MNYSEFKNGEIFSVDFDESMNKSFEPTRRIYFIKLNNNTCYEIICNKIFSRINDNTFCAQGTSIMFNTDGTQNVSDYEKLESVLKDKYYVDDIKAFFNIHTAQNIKFNQSYKSRKLIKRRS